MWEEKENRLYRRFSFRDFSEAFAFMTRVALEAEKMDHHPLWTNAWNRVDIWLSTHDAGDIVTQKDRDLADRIDRIAGIRQP
jgi:4a-hydroxytetrahydrobiopterin dehydratase